MLNVNAPFLKVLPALSQETAEYVAYVAKDPVNQRGEQRVDPNSYLRISNKWKLCLQSLKYDGVSFNSSFGLTHCPLEFYYCNYSHVKRHCFAGCLIRCLIYIFVPGLPSCGWGLNTYSDIFSLCPFTFSLSYPGMFRGFSPGSNQYHWPGLWTAF